MREEHLIGRPRIRANAVAALLILCCHFIPSAVAAPQAVLPGDSIYNIASEWTTQNGKTVRLESLRGRPVVVAMIYLNCPDVCPLIAENMQRIEADLPKPISEDVEFALFSFDSSRDTPDKLKTYASARGLDLRHWTLYRSSDMAARELAAALDVTFRRTEEGAFDHSVMISLLNADGVVVYRQIGLTGDTKDFVSRIKALGANSPDGD